VHRFIDCTEEAVFNPNAFRGELPGWRYYRLEYGGHAQDCLFEGRLLLPPEADVEKVLDALNNTVGQGFVDAYVAKQYEKYNV
jgi:hypothetical protein